MTIEGDTGVPFQGEVYSGGVDDSTGGGGHRDCESQRSAAALSRSQ